MNPNNREKHKQHKGIKEVVLETDNELKYIEKQVKRMADAGGFKRSFIKGNVSLKVSDYI